MTSEPPNGGAKAWEQGVSRHYLALLHDALSIALYLPVTEDPHLCHPQLVSYKLSLTDAQMADPEKQMVLFCTSQTHDAIWGTLLVVLGHHLANLLQLWILITNAA